MTGGSEDVEVTLLPEEWVVVELEDDEPLWALESRELLDELARADEAFG